MIGQRVSALANGAALLFKVRAYIFWGIEDAKHILLGTTFRPNGKKIGNENFEMWLTRHLDPRVDMRFHEFDVDGRHVSLLEIWPCFHTPVRWKQIAYIRVGSACKKLLEYPEKERALWVQASRTPFEVRIAMASRSSDEVLDVLDYDAYFRLTKQGLPSDKNGILERLVGEELLVASGQGRYDITNLGAILFARRLSTFTVLARKAVRVIDYVGNDRTSGGREHVADAGYAVGFEALVDYIKSRLPNNEHIGRALRVETETYPEITIRELVPNAMIHQDFDASGDSPLVEIFKDRLEISNSGLPLISTLRFIDEPPQSRNEKLAAFMRRMYICEERGSGIDKVIQAVEGYQLPPPEFTATERHTRVYVYAFRPFRDMSSKERTRACYQHVCLMYVLNRHATNATLRARFSLSDDDYQMVSKIISMSSSGVNDPPLIKPYDPDNRSRRHARYVPFWA